MIGVKTHILQVVMFSTHPETPLRIRYSLRRRLCITQKIIFELGHPRIVEHQRRIILGDQGAEGTIKCPFDRKKLRYVERISLEVIIL